MKKIFLLSLAALSLTAGAQTVEKTYLFDFGGAGGNRGEITTEPGWNNICPAGTSDTSMPQFSAFTDLVDNTGSTAPGMKLVLTTAWGVNGLSGGGGLLTPDPEQLGDLAVKTATSDYMFNTNNGESGRSFVIAGLDPEKGYRFTIFGSRSANDVRRGNYILSGANSWMTDMQVAGSGLGKDGENQRTGDAPVSDVIFPDAAGNITFWVENHSTTYVPLSCMKMEQFADAVKPSVEGVASRTFLLDFGSEAANRGQATTAPGWNNILANSGNDCTAGTVFGNLIDNKGVETGVSLSVDTKFTTNGYSTGLGLPAPSAALLGDLAVETATYDYFFVDQANASGKITFSGLDPEKAYRFSTFASRKATDARLGAYRFEGLNSWTGAMQAAGNALDGSNSQNEKVVLVSQPVFPDADGKIVLTMINGQKIYLPVNAMKIEELGGIDAPDVKVIAEASIEGNGLLAGEAATLVKRGNNLFEIYVKTDGGEFTVKGTDAEGAEFTLPMILQSGISRITADFDADEVTVIPVTYFCVEGSAAGGWSTTGTELSYAGNGQWKYKGDISGNDTNSDPGRVNFVMNKDWGLTFKRSNGSPSELAYPAGAGEDIPLNPGTYDITVDLNNMTFSFANGLDDLDASRITVMGSSVANGEGASTPSDGVKTGYANLYGKLLAQRAESGLSDNDFFISNISINGNSTLNLLSRFDDLERDYGKWVIYGLSLGNEGIHEASGNDAKEKIYNQWVANMQTLITRARELGKEPIVMNNYTRGDFTAEDYACIKRINEEVALWDVPSVNLLGAIDNGAGIWADNYWSGDVYHPNQAGHEEFFYAMVPSMMDAMLEGKALTMERTATDGYALPAGKSLEFTPDATVHSFTLAFSADTDGDATVATIPVEGTTTPVSIAFSEGKVTASLPDGTILSVPAAAEGLSNIELSQNYARKAVSLTVGENSDFKTGVSPVVPHAVKIGVEGNEAETTRTSQAPLVLGEVMFYRSSMHTSSPFTADGKLNKSSLEVYVPVSDTPANLAMSTVEVKLLDNTSAVVELPVIDDSEVFYFNLQGIRVMNPTQGIYVKVSGGHSSKVIFE